MTVHVRAHEALLSITYAGQSGELSAPVPYTASARDLQAWATEAIAAGDVPGIAPDRRPDLTGFVVDRFPAGKARPHAVLFLRPSTPFG